MHGTEWALINRTGHCYLHGYTVKPPIKDTPKEDDKPKVLS